MSTKKFERHVGYQSAYPFENGVDRYIVSATDGDSTACPFAELADWLRRKFGVGRVVLRPGPNRTFKGKLYVEVYWVQFTAAALNLLTEESPCCG